MKLRVAVAAAALAFASAAVAGPGCHESLGQQAMSCAEGTVWDSASQTCVPQVTS